MVQQRKFGIGIGLCILFLSVSLFLWDFGLTVTELEQNRSRVTLENLAVQGANLIDHKIKDATGMLWGMSRALMYEPDCQSESTLRYLKENVDDVHTDFLRMGIVDTTGIAKRTDGRTIDVSATQFFQQTLQGNNYISSEIIQTHTEQNSNGIVISVPVYDFTGQVKAVLYGVLGTDKLSLYASTVWDVEDTDQYIHIIDDAGNYIVRSRNKNTILEGSNLYEGLRKVNSRITPEDVNAAVRLGESIMTRINREDDVRYAYFAPMDINGWCVVTVLKGDVVDRQVLDLKNLVLRLIVKSLGAVLLFGIFCFWLNREEQKHLQRLNEELSIRDQMFHIAISTMGDFVYTYDLAAHRLEFINYDAARLCVPQVIENFPDNIAQYVTPNSTTDREIQRMIGAVEAGQEDLTGEVIILQDGRPMFYSVQMNRILDEHNQTVRLVGALEDVTAEKETEQKMKKSEQIRSAVLSGAIDFFEVDLNQDCLLQDGVCKDAAYSYSEVIVQFAEMRVAREFRQQVLETLCVDNLLRAYENGEYDISLDYVRQTAVGTEFWANCEVHLKEDVISGDILALVTVWNIDTEKKKELELQEQAVLDPLTHAYNRKACVEKIDAILTAKKDSTHALLMLDLDNFKNINDHLGHAVGDTVLIDVVNIIKHHVHSEDIVCRLGGDEFVVFLVDMPPQVIHRNVTKLVEKLHLVYERDGKREKLSVSVGVALAPMQGCDFQTLYEKADIALYEVKQTCKNGYKIYAEPQEECIAEETIADVTMEI